MSCKEHLALARRNVTFAADEARKVGIEVLVEAINTFENRPHLLSTTEQAAGFVRSVGLENVKVQHDLYHMQRMEGNLVATLERYVGMIGHVQIADSPGRGEPGTGEIRYPYVLSRLEELGHEGYVGLEYNPTTGTTEESLAWLPRALRAWNVSVEDLKL
jgi:hydroxypyruvate isomerase